MASSVDKLFQQGRLEKVEADPEGAEAKLAEARKHLDSARKILDDDPEGGYSLLYDAARKSFDALMLHNGVRVTKGEGEHAIRGQYGAATLKSSQHRKSIDHFDAMRRQRNRSQYGSWHISAAEAETDLEHAELIAKAVEEALNT